MIVRGEPIIEYTLLAELSKEVELSNALLNEISAKDYAAVWDRKFINDLSNSAFAVIEKGYSDGKDRRARHLPHHGKDVKSATENSSVDLAHYRNALTRVNQIKSVLGIESDSSLRKRAAVHLEGHRKVLMDSKGSFNQIELSIWENCECLFIINVKPFLSDLGSEEDDNG
jgi:hypothetical protein